MHRFIFIVLLFLVSACSRDMEGSPSHSFRVFNENGVMIAENSGGSKYEGEIFQYMDLRHLKQDESQPATLLGTAGEAYVGENDLVYVRDNRNRRIAVFDLQGDFCFSFGREGSGPGEFNQIGRLQLTDESILVGDSRLQRVAVFSLDGQFIRSIAYPQIPSDPALRYGTFFVYPVNAGQMVVAQQAFEFTPGSSMIKSAHRIGLLSADKELIFAVESPLSRPPFPYEGYGTVRYQPGQGILLVDGHRPVLSWYNLDGAIRVTIRIEVDPEPVTALDRERVREVLQKEIDEADRDELRESFRRRLEEIEFPEYKGFTNDTRSDEYGFVWALVPLDVFIDPPWVSSHRLISPEGEYLGNTSFPRIEGINVRYHLSRGYLIYCYIDVDTGAPKVSLYRIVSAMEGLEYPQVKKRL